MPTTTQEGGGGGDRLRVVIGDSVTCSLEQPWFRERMLSKPPA